MQNEWIKVYVKKVFFYVYLCKVKKQSKYVMDLQIW